jgi:hypothetical protein
VRVRGFNFSRNQCGGKLRPGAPDRLPGQRNRQKLLGGSTPEAWGPGKEACNYASNQRICALDFHPV